MYSFAQRLDTAVLDEPFYGFYLQYTGLLHPGRDEIIQSIETNASQIFSTIAALEAKKGNVFIKNMGHHLQGFDYSQIQTYENVFLIRDPAHMLASYAKVREQPTLQDIGLQQQADLFAWLQKSEKKPIVIDGNRVRMHPVAELSALCRKLNLPFTERMLQWPAGPKSYDGIWAKYWYSNVHQSTRFNPPDAKTTYLPEHLRTVYEEALPHYKFLSSYIKS
jgi:hypothetical protein